MTIACNVLLRRLTIKQLTCFILFLISIYFFIYHVVSRHSMPSLEILDENDERDDRSSILGRSCEIVNGKCLPFEVNGVKLPKKLFPFHSKFYLNGRPFTILSGSFHYFRTMPEQWGDRILKIQAAGLNTIMTYVPWNLHEPYDGMIQFGGRWNLVDFIKMVHKMKMKAIIRPGPYICSEWEFGGLPSWLLRSEKMKFRMNNKEFLAKVTRFFSHLLPLLAQYQYSTGNGPIIAFQLENEYGAFLKYLNGQSRTSYLLFLKSLFKKYGITELIFTSDATGDFGQSRLAGTLMAINFQTGASQHLKKLKYIQPEKPLFVAEWWTGWFDHWSKPHHQTSLETFKTELSHIISHNASINLYMMAGGTNFGFWNGANNHSIEIGYQPTITSYDYDAPIAENGKLREKFYILRRILSHLSQTPLPEPPPPSPSIKLKSSVLEPLISLPKLVEYLSNYYQRVHKNIICMEDLEIHSNSGQSFGFLHLQSRCAEDTKTITLKGLIRDRLYLYVDGAFKKCLNFYDPFSNKIERSGAKGECKVELLIENLGRVNYGNVLELQRKGFLGEVFADDEKMLNWTHTVLDFSDEMIMGLKNIKKNSSYHLPMLYKAEFDIDREIGDTFLDTSNFGKGVILVNDFLIGRYWDVGPQKTLYVPAPLLRKKKNSIMVFELEKKINELKFSRKHLLL